MSSFNDKCKKALVEIEKVAYGKIKHINNQARILHIADILSSVVVNGEFKQNSDIKESSIDVEMIENLDELYKEYYEANFKAYYFLEKANSIEERIEKINKEKLIQ